MNKKIVIMILLFSGFLMLRADNVKAETNSFCVCSYAYISSLSDPQSCPTELSVWAFKETDPTKCTETVVKNFVEQVPGDTMCKLGVCEIKICNSSKDILQSHPIKPPGGDDGPIILACVSTADFGGLDECAKTIAGLNCNEKLPSTMGGESKTSVCLSSCIVKNGCEFNDSTSICSACGNKLDASMECGKSENISECTEKCKSEFCEFKDGVCGGRSTVATDTGTGAGTGTGVNTFDYNNAYFQGQYPVPKGYNGALPPCAFSGTCRDVNSLVELIIRWASGFFAILGSFAFVYFIYGGFVIMLSMGNAEKVKKGQQTIVAAVIGLFIAFSAYLAIDFMLDALNVSDTFRGIK